MKKEKDVTPIEETENVETTSKCKVGKKSKIIICLSIIFVIVAAVLVLLQVVCKDKGDKKYSVVDGKFNKTTYFYEKVDSDKEGPMPSYYVFDKDGKYVVISVSPNPFGEAGSYKIDGDEITFSRRYYYTTKGGLEVTDPTTNSTGHVNLGSYNGDEIIIYGHKSKKVDEFKFKKDVDKFYTFSDIEKAYKNQDNDTPVVPDEDDDEEDEKISYPINSSVMEINGGGTGFDEYKYTLGTKVFYVTTTTEEDGENYEIRNSNDKIIAKTFGYYPDGATLAFNDDGSVSYLSEYDTKKECYSYKRFDNNGKEIKTSECVSTIVDNYIILIENNHVKLKTYDGKYVKGFDFDLSKGNYHFIGIASGWYTDQGKNGIFAVIEDHDKEDGEKGVKLEYYFEPKTGKIGTILLDEMGGYAKPVLYLYPEKETKVKVSFEKPELLTTTYPKFKNAWEVIAKPNGDLKDKDGNYYYGLYWEEEGSTNVDFTEGFYVTKDNAIKFLEEKLSYIGLSDRERNEFIMYWLPILEKNGKSVVYFELTEERNAFNKLIIKPNPDSLLRVAIHVKKVSSKPNNLKEEKLVKFNRSGFTAVEWGGVIH